MVIRTPAKRPMEFAVCFLDREVIDASEPMVHGAVRPRIEFSSTSAIVFAYTR